MKYTNLSIKTRVTSSLIVGIILGCLTALLLVLALRKDEYKSTDKDRYVLIVIAGMTTIASLAAFEQYRESEEKNFSVDVAFNEQFVSMSINEGSEKAKLTSGNEEVYNKPKSLPWDLSLSQLVSEDNSLALARLRIEIEKELRRIAYSNSIDINERPLGVVSLAQELASKKIIPEIWVEAIKEITLVCNQAIHGLKVSDDTTASVVRIGGQFLEKLRLVSVNIPH